ncbi:MAG: histidine kinase [Lawsonibacter sp.]|nr:histidine kinase [Lawsonibacter sp.]
MEKKSNRPFQDYFQRMLLRTTFVPLIAVLLAIFLIVSGLYGYLLCSQTGKRADAVTDTLQEVLMPYISQIQEYAGSEWICQLLTEQTDTVGAYETFYSFTNRQAVKCEFYLLKADGQMVLRSNTIVPEYLQHSPPLPFGLLKRADYARGGVVLMLNSRSNSCSDRVFSIAQRVQEQGKTAGFLVFEIDKDEIFDLIYTKGSSDLILADSQESVLLTTRNSLLDENQKTHEDFRNAAGFRLIGDSFYYIVQRAIPLLGLKLYVITDLDSLRSALMLSVVILAFLLLAGLCILYLAFRRIAYAEASSVDQMIESLRQMQEEGIYTQLEIESKGALQPLENAFRRMLADIRELVEVSNREQRRSVRAEIKQLESQFDVHFLYNTLEVIRSLIKLDPKQASRMIVDFSTLLRYSTDNTKELVSLRDDMLYMEKYLAIANARFNNSFHYEIQMEENLLDCRVPRLLLQPMVENTLKYCTRSREGLWVRIEGCKTDSDRIDLRVIDNGIGIPEDVQEEIRQSLVTEQLPPQHTGLYNIHRRIQLIYGRSFGISEMSSSPCGTRIQITIPYVKGGAPGG